MRDEVQERSAKFLVTTLSISIQVHPDPKKWQKFMEQLRLKDLFYPDLRVKALGDRAGFPVLNLAQPFQSYAEENQVYLHGFEDTELGESHWNEHGHRLAGKIIADKICTEVSL